MTNLSRRHLLLSSAGLALVGAVGRAQEAEFPLDHTVQTAPHLEPAIPRPDQETAVAAKLAALRSAKGRAPNIVIFLVDDMGWGDPGCFGGGAMIGAPTPNIDALAEGGLKLVSAYSQPTCTPTRAALMTGRIPVRSGLTRPTLSGEQPAVNPFEIEVTNAKLLSDAGYKTALSGKWHLGEAEGQYPHQAGFDEYFGILSVVSDISQQVDQRLYPDMLLNPERVAATHAASPAEVTKGVKGGPLEVENPITTTEELSVIDQQFADFSEDFIRRTAETEQPFYLYHSFARLHNDVFPAPGYAGKSPSRLPIRDALIEVDDIVGQLMDVLRDTGQEDNTFVFFTSDNGGNEDAYPDVSYQPFRGGKGTTWEGGVRVSTIAYWPGMIAPDKTTDGILDLCDFFNTSLGIAGVVDQIPTERYIDGIDQTSFLLSEDGLSHRDTVFIYNQSALTAVRWNEYKVHFAVFDVQAAGRNLDEANYLPVGLAPWVYNLYLDPKEMRSQGHLRFEWGMPEVLRRVGKHAATMATYQNTDLGLAIP